MAEDGIDLWCAHNGVMSEFDQHATLDDVTGGYSYHSRSRVAGDDMSDTWHFIRIVLQPLLKPSLGGNPKALRNPVVRALLRNLIGSSNKLAIMDSDGEQWIINEEEFVSWPAYGLICSNTYAWESAAGNCTDLASWVKPVSKAAGDPRLAQRMLAPAYVPPLLKGWDRIAVDDEAAQDALDNDEWHNCQIVADQFWDDLNLTCPGAAAELDVDDLASYLLTQGQTELQKLMTQLAQGDLHWMEFVDFVFEGIRVA